MLRSKIKSQSARNHSADTPMDEYRRARAGGLVDWVVNFLAFTITDRPKPGLAIISLDPKALPQICIVWQTRWQYSVPWELAMAA